MGNFVSLCKEHVKKKKKGEQVTLPVCVRSM